MRPERADTAAIAKGGRVYPGLAHELARNAEQMGAAGDGAEDGGLRLSLDEFLQIDERRRPVVGVGGGPEVDGIAQPPDRLHEPPSARPPAKKILDGWRGQARGDGGAADKAGVARPEQHGTIVAPKRPASGQALDQPRPVFQAAGVHPGAGQLGADPFQEAVGIAPRQAHGGTARLQIRIGEEVGAPRPQAGPQGRKGGGAGAGAEQDQIAGVVQIRLSRLASAASLPARGNWSMNRLPLPGWLSALRRPPRALAIRCATASPKPTPPTRRANAASDRTPRKCGEDRRPRRRTPRPPLRQ